MNRARKADKVKFWVSLPIAEVSPDWRCPCGCGRTLQELGDSGVDFLVVLARTNPSEFFGPQIPPASSRQGRSRGPGRRPVRAEAGRSEP
jgi:hypothetical protein